ncbi:MAG: hypothetical protein AAF993_18045 [Pseudomonadota bacterium]
MMTTDFNFNQALQPLNDWVTPLIKTGIGTPLNWTPGLVLLEMKGRNSGRDLSVPLVGYLAYPYVTIGTVRSASQWIKNLRAVEDAYLWVWGRRYAFEKVLVRDQLIVGQLQTNR